MVWAALFVYLAYILTGSTPVFHGEWLIKDSKTQFKKVIKDEARSKNAMKILDEMIADAKCFNGDAAKAQEDLKKLVIDYNSTREDFNKLFGEINGKRVASTEKILGRIPDLKKNILREEWEMAFRDETTRRSGDEVH